MPINNLSIICLREQRIERQSFGEQESTILNYLGSLPFSKMETLRSGKLCLGQVHLSLGNNEFIIAWARTIWRAIGGWNLLKN